MYDQLEVAHSRIESLEDLLKKVRDMFTTLASDNTSPKYKTILVEIEKVLS